ADLDKVFAKTNTLMLNDEEARLYAGEHNLRKAAAAILKAGPSSLIIKRGDAGALLFHGGGVFAAPAMPLADVKDPTGAGDSFAGGLMGSFAVEQFSVDGLRELTTARIQQRFDELAELAHFERVRL